MQGGELVEEEDEEEEEEGHEHRYSRRVRQQVQRYSPRPEELGAPSGRDRRRRSDERGSSDSEGQEEEEEEEGDSGDEEQLRRGGEGGRRVLRHTEAFTARYSARERRTVDRFNPMSYGGSQGGAGPLLDTQGGEPPGSRKRRRERGREGGGGGSSDSGGGSSGEEEEERGEGGEEEEEEGKEEEEPAERKQYSFRDRALVTINPHLTSLTSSQQQQQPGALHRHPSLAAGGHDRKRPRGDRRDRGGSRLRRTGSRRRLDSDIDDVPDQASPDAWRAVAPPPGAGGLVPYTGGAGGAVVAAGAGPQPHGGTGGGGGGAPQPWELAQGWGEAGGGGGAKGGNAEITPLQVDPSLTFDAVGGLEHYIKASAGARPGGGGWRGDRGGQAHGCGVRG